MERSRGVLGGIPEAQAGPYLHYGVKLAAVDPAVSYKYFMTLPQIHNQIPADQFAAWFEEGFPLIGESPLGALAYFGLESKRSWDRLQTNMPAISLAEISRPLKLLAQALSGRSLGIRAIQEKGDKQKPSSPFAPFTDGETIFLPETIRDFASSDRNFLAFKLSAAHQAGNIEFGTFGFQLSSVHDLFSPEYMRSCLRGISEKGKEVSPLEAFFQLFPRKELARDIFRLLEGIRVDQRLRKEYRGLKKEIEILVPEVLESRPALDSLPLQMMILEAVFRTAVEGKPPKLPPPLLRIGGGIVRLVSPLLREGASVRDSARSTVMLYRWLDGIPNIRIDRHDGAAGLELPQTPAESGGRERVERIRGGEEEPYRGFPPPRHWGEIRPDMVQKKIRIEKVKRALDGMERGRALTPEELKELMERGLEELELSEGEGAENDFQGLFVTDLKGRKKMRMLKSAVGGAKESLRKELKSLLGEIGDSTEADYYYDEWDYQIADYRVKWCRLKEREIEPGSTAFVDRTLASYSALVAEVRRQFQMLKPERFKRIPNLERGEEIDLNAAIESLIDRRAGQSPSDKIYVEKNRKDRDFSTIFLLDMSASTDELAEGDDGEKKKVIDIEKESLVIMAEALREIGDEYAMFGFSGYGRQEVDFYRIKDFREVYESPVKGRVENIRPQRSTRMGPVIRHAVWKMARRESRVKNLVLISDGYPQDYDYGDDRSDREYALQDTAAALEEAARKQIHAFCITVDRAGHDYLRKMLPPS
ncbi:MAG TPA: hypothetical protein VLS90_05765, partial [Thermodesulfobacteriota bacterium]|nr:hypothetical protein [Thermodesulfobacteriota bacterium]